MAQNGTKHGFCDQDFKLLAKWHKQLEVECPLFEFQKKIYKLFNFFKISKISKISTKKIQKKSKKNPIIIE
jgi:hypothetical protein